MKATKKINIQASIKRLNAKYKAATAAQRRIMVAKDVIANINAGKFVATQGCWTDVRVGQSEYANDIAPLQPILHEPKTTCECCGIGAVFLSYVRLNNKATGSQGHSFWDINKATGWPLANMRLIELAFEMGEGNCKPKDKEEEKAVRFATDEPSDERLILIMKNIIANKKTGLFTP